MIGAGSASGENVIQKTIITVDRHTDSVSWSQCPNEQQVIDKGKDCSSSNLDLDQDRVLNMPNASSEIAIVNSKQQ